MKDGLTTHAVIEAGPLLLGNLFKHYLSPRTDRKDQDGQDTARVEFFYDEIFTLAKRFLNIATLHTTDAFQKFGQTRTPAPPWVAVHRLTIPPETSQRAAEQVIKGLGGEDMAFKIVGGTQWWQVRAGPGVECEWIVMKKTKQDAEERQCSAERVAEDSGFIPEMDRLRCILYIHGGGYYFGSINTHRYLIWRLAKKIGGRCFAVNYRKAPQYPFPCAIQDVVAAYLYLINPPKDAPHRPVDPKNIVICGDSAGGGLTWVLLQIIRDNGLPMPAGAALISPWSDLTHSFPSILQNTATDVVPPHSFIHKPSSLWPPPPPKLTQEMQRGIAAKVKKAVGQIAEGQELDLTHHHTIPDDMPMVTGPPYLDDFIHTSDPHAHAKLQKMLKRGEVNLETASMANPAVKFAELKPLHTSHDALPDPEATLASCDDTLQLVLDNDETMMIDTQIQIYARNSQLCHPWVSPALSYLGGLCPLYIMCGNSEVLRDEIIYAAHKAAHPEEHPVRDDVRQLMPSLKGIEDRFGPTDVHLQVYDGVGHDLPLFCMTKPSRGCVRAIATFTRYVTPSAPGSLSLDPPPASRRSSASSATPAAAPADKKILGKDLVDSPTLTRTPTTVDMASPVTAKPAELNKRLQQVRLDAARESASQQRSGSGTLSETTSETPTSGDDAGPRWSADVSKAKPGEAGYPGIYAGEPFTNHMIRERVDFDGVLRPLEPEEKLGAMTMPRDQIGMIKAGPGMRYIEGQSSWDQRFSHTFRKVSRHRRRNLQQSLNRDSKKIMDKWVRAAEISRKMNKDVRLRMPKENVGKENAGKESSDLNSEANSESEGGSSGSELEWDVPDAEHVTMDGSWAWQWALNGETPPPSAIVARRDVPEGRKTALQADQVDPENDTEMHALSLWVLMAQVFSSSSEHARAKDALKEAKEMHAEQRRHKKTNSFGSKLSGLFKRKNSALREATV